MRNGSPASERGPRGRNSMRILKVGTTGHDGKTARRRLALVGLLLTAAAVLVVAGTVGGAAFAADVQHGIARAKGCVSPTTVGSPYTCSYTVRNEVDDAHDTLMISGLGDVVQSAGGAVASGNVLDKLKLVFVQGTAVTPPSCTGGTGSGTDADPYTGATSCVLPFGSRIL